MNGSLLHRRMIHDSRRCYYLFHCASTVMELQDPAKPQLRFQEQGQLEASPAEESMTLLVRVRPSFMIPRLCQVDVQTFVLRHLSSPQ